MSLHDLFGWDLLYKTIESNITVESEIIIALAHWFLIRHSSFRCVGMGDDKTLSENDTESDLLPDGWNDSEDSYALRYKFDKKLYLLLAAKTDDTIVLNLIDVKTRDVSHLSLNPTETVKSLKGPIKTMVPGLTELLDRFKKELVDPVFTGTKKEVTTQTACTSEKARSSPPRLPNDPFGIPPPGNPLLIPSGSRDPLRDIGRSDLDPLGRSGSAGMIFSPPRLPFEPPGGFGPGMGFPPPPGARFDPFSPPDPDRPLRGNPNPNHFRPPPDFDDMYM